jgi:hypothetical protein
MKNVNFSKGQLVRFHAICDESGYATELYGVEPQNNFFDVLVSIETLYGEFIRKNLIEVIGNHGKRTGKFYKIKNGIIESEHLRLLKIKDKYQLKLKEIFSESDIKTMNEFLKIRPIDYIQLISTTQKENCISRPPRVNEPVTIWEKCNGMGYRLIGRFYYENGNWFYNETKKVNEKINDLSLWEKELNRIYFNGKIYIQDGLI